MYSWKRIWYGLTGGMSRKALMIALSLAMVMASVTGGTLAWLHSGEQKVNNVFTVGDISIALQETDTTLDGDNNPNTNLYEMGLGQVISKDPTVVVNAHSDDCWLFVEINESANFAEFMTYALADGWLPLAGHAGVWYRSVDAADEAQVFPVLLDSTVTVKDTVTLGMLSTLDAATYPTLTFTAYAVQRDGAVEQLSTPENAWQVLGRPDPTVQADII